MSRFVKLVGAIVDVIDAKMEARQKRNSLLKLLADNEAELHDLAQQGFDDPASLSHDEIRALGAMTLARNRD